MKQLLKLRICTSAGIVQEGLELLAQCLMICSARLSLAERLGDLLGVIVTSRLRCHHENEINWSGGIVLEATGRNIPNFVVTEGNLPSVFL